MSPPSFQPIAIIGLSALFPQARSVDEFWRLILSGRDCMQEIPATHWLIEDYFDADPKVPVKTYSKHGAFLKDVPFDPVAYGLPPNMLPSTDIAQILALILARQVLEDCSGGQIAKLALDRTSVILGVASATEMISSMSGLLTRPMWIEGMRRAGIPETQVQEAAKRITALFPEWNENTFPGCLGNVVAGRVANRFNLGGTNCVTDAACASSLAALHMGIGELQLGTSDRVITGGVDALNTIFMYMCFSKTPAMSASGHCRPFSAAADGTMMGEGGGMLALRRLEDAERDGDTIYAVIRGLGSSSDGRSKSVYAPRPEGQAVALQRCYERAGYSPASVRLVEAHGTGTAAGDRCEATALKDVFAAADGVRRQWCALGSVKSQIGHTKGAAGTAGMIKVALALRHQAFPPTANVDTPNPELGFAESPLYLSTKARPWIQASGEPRRGAVSSFGFGGTNFHVALEEYRGAAPAPRVRAFGAEVFLVGGATGAELVALVAAWAKPTATEFGTAARASQQAFDAGAACRGAIVAASPEDLAAKAGKLLERLTDARRGPQPALEGVCFSTEPRAAGAPGLVYLFPGQGSQSVGMAGELPMQFEAAMQAWEKTESLGLLGAERLCDIVYPPPATNEGDATRQEEKLRRTEHAQPALGAVSLGYLAVLDAAGLRPELVGGHSYGEIPALHAAGVLSWKDCLRISRQRGELMAEVSRDHAGAMTAVWHPADALSAMLAGECAGCVIANQNSPQQSVVAGPVAQIERLEAELTEAKVSFRRLQVATAFHSEAVSDACAPFERFLADVKFAAPAVPVFNNTTAAPYPAKAEAMRALLAAQLAQPVRFADQLRAMQAAGGRIFVEVGAGAVLSGLARQTLGESATLIALNPLGAPADVGLLNGLARLAVAGVAVMWDFLWHGHRVPPPEVKLSAAALPVGGYNLGRPYPPRDGVKTAPVATPVIALAAPAPAPPVAAAVRPEISRMTAAPVPTPPPSALPAVPAAPARARPAAAGDAVARAHETFLRTMSDAHRTFLETVSGSAVRAPEAAAARVTAPAAPAAPVVKIPAAVPAMPAVRAMPAPPSARTAQAMAAPGPTRRVTAPLPVAVVVAAAPIAAFDSAQVIELVLGTVAEKTGYPREMLEPGMQLESDLGIDSIKRVEILSAVQKKLPGLPAVDAKVMGGLQTLQAISDYLSERLGGGAKAAPAPAPAAAASGADLPVRRYGVSAVAAEAPGFALAGLHRVTRLAITDDGRGVAAALRAALAEHRIAAEVVTAVPADCDGLILLEGLRPDAGAEAATAAHQAAFAAARAAAGRIAENGGLLVTVQDTGGGFGLGGVPVARGWLGGFAGLAKTAAKEWPRAAVRSIDLECSGQTPAQLGRRLADELRFGGDERETGLGATGARLRLVVTERPWAKAGVARVTTKSVVVASGGARGVTASALVALAQAHQPLIALLGRTALGDEPAECAGLADEAALRQALLAREQRAGRTMAPKALAAAVRDVLAQREIRATLERLRAAGSLAEYFACDTTDASSVTATLAQVRAALGPITVLVHGAGVLADKLIAEKTPEQFARVFATKVRGLQVLLEATAGDPLDALVLFSSVAGRFGNRGQSDYAMANEVLNKVAQAEFLRRGGRCLVRSINWGPWDGGMVTPALREHFHAQGVGLIPHDAGAAALVREFAGAATADEVEVVIGAGRLDLAADPALPTHRVEIAVSAERYPFLLDHVVKGRVVVPVALVTEWLLQAAALARPDVAPRALRDVQVMKAVFVDENSAEATLLELTTRTLADGAVEVRIADPVSGKAHYGAVADYGRGSTAPLKLPGKNGSGWREFSFDPAGAYDGRLFHGPEFQVIRALGGWSSEGAALTLDNRPLGQLGAAPWKIGPALFDGALQAAVLWSLEAHGKSSLPLRIAEVALTRPARADEAVSCRLSGREQPGVGAVTDIDCVDAKGAPIFSLRGVECFHVDSYWNQVTT